jgi:hypothetical protein
VYIIQLCFISPILELTLNIDDAYIEAQRLGESNSTLCAPDSAFESDYASCVSCLTANGYNETLLSNVTSEFQPFIAFCSAGSETASTQLSQAKSSLLAQASSLGLTLVSTVQVTQTSFLNYTVTVSQPSTSQISLTPLTFDC